MTSISSSNASTQKSSRTPSDIRSKSCDTACTSNCTCYFKRRKQMNPLAYSIRPTYHKNNVNPVKQRVMSAKLLKLRQLQSQLNDANFHLAEIARENQVLKTLQKRQDKALSKYENTHADLPRLLHSHEEELRVVSEKNKNLRKTVKELTEQLKQKEEDLVKTREQLSHLEKLNKDKHLIEREKLMEQIDDLKIRLQKSEEQVTVLNRKVILENKTSRQRLNSEMNKNKQSQKELLNALDEIDRLTGLLEVKENVVRPRNPKFFKDQVKNNPAMIPLRHYKPHISEDKLNMMKENGQVPVTEVKLEPITFTRKDSGSSGSRKSSDSFKIPMESIKQRLTNDPQKRNYEINGFSSYNPEMLENQGHSPGNGRNRPSSSIKLDKLPIVTENHTFSEKIKVEDKTLESQEQITDFPCNNSGVTDSFLKEEKRISEMQYQNDEKLKEIGFKDVETESNKSSDEETSNSRNKKKQTTKLAQLLSYKNKGNVNSDNSSATSSPPSEESFGKLTESLDAAIQKAAENSKEEFDKELGNYCSEVLTSVKNCNKVIEVHKKSLLTSKKDTETLLDNLRKAEKAEQKLQNSFFNMDDDLNFVHEILNEEYKFQVVHTDTQEPLKSKKPLVNLENKKKLLATLRAIDNGDSIDSLEESQSGIMKEMFGHVAH